MFEGVVYLFGNLVIGSGLEEFAEVEEVDCLC
jgi:hypothetical protein